MELKRPLSFHGDFWQGLTTLSVSHQASAALVAMTLTFLPITLLVWSLIAHAQGAAEECQHPLVDGDRALPEGFVGNEDFYGLGIRLGIYTQWLASVIANPLLKSERTSMAGAYLTFSLALAVAVLILVFQRECTFTAEIIVVLNIFWGGTLLVMVPFIRLLADIRTTGLGLAMIPLILSMLPVSAWFWLRLAFWGELDFTPTPGEGTCLFLLAPVTPTHFRNVSIFLALLCLVLCLIPAFSSVCLSLALFLDWIGQQPPHLRQAEQKKSIAARIRDHIQRVRDRRGKLQPERSHGRWIIAVVSVIVVLWSILAVELTLIWNGVSEIYSLQSTGQIIPLVVGLGILVKVLWILRHGKVSRHPE